MKRKITTLSLLIAFSLITFYSEAQTGVAIGTGTPIPNGAAMLDVQSTTLGVLIPRMATKPSSLAATKANGLLIYDSTSKAFFYNTSNSTVPTWIQMSSPSGIITGNGVSNNLARWTGSNTLSTGITYDNGTVAGINISSFSTTDRFTVIAGTGTAGTSLNGINVNTVNSNSGGYALHTNSTFSGNLTDIYLGYAGTTSSVGGFSASNPAIYTNVTANSNPAIFAATSGTNTSSAIYGVSSVANGGVFGSSLASGIGVIGLNSVTAGTGSGIGIDGQTNQSSGYGVFGLNAATSGNAVAIEGQSSYSNGIAAVVGLNTAPASTNAADGVDGYTAQSGGAGIYGENANTTATIGANSVAAAVWAQSDHTSGTGVFGTGNGTAGSLLTTGQGGAFTGTTTGVSAFASSSSAAQSIYTNDFGNVVRVNYWDGTIQYKINGVGTVSTIVPGINNDYVTLHAPESPEIYFEDYGEGQLSNGRMHIDIDPIFTQNVAINEKHPLRVFIQLEGDCNGVYVTNKTKTGFDVVELKDGTSNVSFQWHIVCNRADEQLPNGRVSHNQDTRFEKASPALPSSTALLIKKQTFELLQPAIALPNK
jgi:hypothetical protein